MWESTPSTNPSTPTTSSTHQVQNTLPSSSFTHEKVNVNAKSKKDIHSNAFSFSTSPSSTYSTTNAFTLLSSNVHQLVSFEDEVPKNTSSTFSKFFNGVLSSFHHAFPSYQSTSILSSTDDPDSSSKLSNIHLEGSAGITSSSSIDPTPSQNIDNDRYHQHMDGERLSLPEKSRLISKTLPTSLITIPSQTCIEHPDPLIEMHSSQTAPFFSNPTNRESFYSTLDGWLLQPPNSNFHFPFRVHRLSSLDEPIMNSSFSSKSNVVSNPSPFKIPSNSTPSVLCKSASLPNIKSARRASCPSSFFILSKSSASSLSFSTSSPRMLHVLQVPCEDNEAHLSPQEKTNSKSPSHQLPASPPLLLTMSPLDTDFPSTVHRFSDATSSCCPCDMETALSPTFWSPSVPLDETSMENLSPSLVPSHSWPLSLNAAYSSLSSSTLPSSISSPFLSLPSKELDSTFSTPLIPAVPPLPPAVSPPPSFLGEKKKKKSSSTSSFPFQRLFRGLRREEPPPPVLPPRHFWMKDETCQECYDCQLPFSTFRRKHHCRVCGQIFCYRCASKIIPGEPLGFLGLVRVCNYCLDVMLRHCHSNLSNDASILSTPMSSPPMSPRPSSVIAPTLLFRHQRRRSFSSFTLNHFLSFSEHDVSFPESSQEETMQSPASLTSTTIETKESPIKSWGPEKHPHESPVLTNQGLEPIHPPTLRTSPDGFMTSMPPTLLTDWSSSGTHMEPRMHSIQEIRTTTLKTLESMNLAAVKHSPISLGSILSPEETLSEIAFPILNEEVPVHSPSFSSNSMLSHYLKPGKEHTRLPDLSLDHGKHNIFLKRRAMVVRGSYPDVSTVIKQDPMSEIINFPNQEERMEAPISSMDPFLHPACQQHLALLIQQQLLKLNLSETWLSELLTLCRQAMLHFLKTQTKDLGGTLDRDFDWSRWVSFKKIPGGAPHDSFFFHGTYCKKALAHNRMPTSLLQPKVLLINFSLEYHRIEHELMSLNPVLAQERQHLEHLCNRLVQLNPNLVLVHGTVSRLALEYLFSQYGISVAYSVNMSDMVRIAHCLHTDIVTSIDQLMTTRLGQCARFQGHLYRYKDTCVPWMQFEGCQEPSGCFLLRGASGARLSTVKQVLQLTLFATFSMYNETLFYKALKVTPVVIHHPQVVSVSPGVALFQKETSPVHHQTLHCLFFYKSEKCCEWKSFALDFYGHGDATVHTMFSHFVSSLLCPHCALPFYSHQRKFVHGQRQVLVQVTQSNEVTSSHWQCDCGQQFTFEFQPTGFSFAKYLELMFYVPWALTPCGHPMFLTKQHFQLHDSMVHVESQEIRLYRIHAPEMRKDGSLSDGLEAMSLPNSSPLVLNEEEISSFVAYSLLSMEYNETLEKLAKEVSDVFKASPFKDVSAPLLEVDEDALGENWLLEKERNANTGHIDVEFSQGSITAVCRTYFATEFDTLRSRHALDTIYPMSLSHCQKWETTGGKSGSHFLKTLDDRFVLKQLSKLELELFILLAPSYFAYMQKTFFNKVFDLKGATRHRYASAGQVLLDGNFIEMSLDSPILLSVQGHKSLLTAIYNDTLFLSKLNIMDYSLLMGLDEANHEVVVGIIDFIRTYTWDKKLESWVKETGLLGGGKEPTIVSPKQYRTRFRDAMERYFLAVPDAMCCLGSFMGNHCTDPIL
ncbi:1-phosphatidylinositol-3-phosphate 5-kinase [Coelomomyces lativittatus]|nr:1-phosphatidylinositol-3-phosphate 5-kinase [Coelomomyces lativittatus]